MTDDSPIKTHQPCPDCGHNDCLSVWSGGATHCHSCGKKTTGGGVPVEELPKGNFSIQLKERGISSETAKKFNVSVDKVPYKHYYPYYELIDDGLRTGGKVAVKVRQVDDKDFYTKGQINKTGLFGMNTFQPGSSKYITLTEGECDAMAVYQMMGYPAVSVKSATQAVKDCKAAFNYLNSFERIYVCMDMDEAGQKEVSKVSDLFSPGKVYHVKMSMKDANEFLVKGEEKKFKSEWWASAPIQPDGIVSGQEMWDIVSKVDINECIPWPWKGLNRYTYGRRMGEMYTIIAGSGMGKTQILRECQYYDITNTDYNIGCMMMEETLKSAGNGIMSIKAGKMLHLPNKEFVDKLKLKFPGTFDDLEGIEVSEEDMKEYFDSTLGTGKVHFYNSFGSNSIDNIINRIKYFAKALDCRIIYLDHISILVSDQQNGDERKALDEIATKLKTHCIELDISLIMVSHTKRQTGKAHEEGGKTSLDDIRGTAGIGQLSNIVIGLERDGQAEDEIDRNTTTVRILKNRFLGKTGPACMLHYDDESGRLTEVTTEDLEIMKGFET